MGCVSNSGPTKMSINWKWTPNFESWLNYKLPARKCVVVNIWVLTCFDPPNQPTSGYHLLNSYVVCASSGVIPNFSHTLISLPTFLWPWPAWFCAAVWWCHSWPKGLARWCPPRCHPFPTCQWWRCFLAARGRSQTGPSTSGWWKMQKVHPKNKKLELQRSGENIGKYESHHHSKSIYPLGAQRIKVHKHDTRFGTSGKLFDSATGQPQKSD